MHQFTYDGAGRLISPDHGNTFYLYHAEGNRVAKQVGGVSTYQYLYDPSGNQITELTPQGWNRGEVYAGDRHIATYFAGTTFFAHSDWLGDQRVNSAISGTVQNTCTNLPFGDSLNCTGPANPLDYTGKQRDSESGNDYFGARYYASSLGRFLSADDSGGDASPVPYAAFDDPQSLNLYSYVLNNPLANVDRDGHLCDGLTEETSVTLLGIPGDKKTSTGQQSDCFSIDWNGLVTGFSNAAQRATDATQHAMSAVQQWSSLPRDSTCMNGATAIGAGIGAAAGVHIGATVGGAAGAVVAAPTGEAAAVLTVPGGAALGGVAGGFIGSGAGALAGRGLGWFMCAQGGGGGGGGGGSSAKAAKKLSTSQADEAARKGGYAGAEDLKKAIVGEHGSQYDLYKQPNGDVEIFAKGGVGEGIETGINIKN
jgi:RHS repeat-associated protein